MKTFKGAYVTLLKTSIGSGVLSFPLLFRHYGILPAVCMTILSGFFASVGLMLLATCANEVGRTADFSSLTSLSIPYARLAVDLAVFVKCFGVSLSYLIIVKQLITPFLEVFMNVPPLFKKPWISLTIFLIFISPFSYSNDLDNLKYTSFLGVACIFVVVVSSWYRLVYQPYTLGNPILWIAPFTLKWLSSLGKFVFCFTCHQNIFAANSELKNNSIQQMKALIYLVASSAFFLYVGFGLSNYLLYLSSLKDNALENFPSDYLGAFTRGLYIIVMAVSYPLQIVPARRYFLNMLHLTPDTKHWKTCNMACTTILILLTYGIAVSGVQLGIVYALVGATASTFMCLVLPPLFYLNMDIEKTKYLVILGHCAFLFGIVVFFATISGILADYC